MASKRSLVPVERIERSILFIRGQKVLLDEDLAVLYGVTTKRLNEQVRRNKDRFPPDFMFQLTGEEATALRSQNATSKSGRGGRRYAPHVFTEHGAVMLASVLNTPVAVQASILVVRAFVRLRDLLAGNKELAHKLAELEQKLSIHDTAILKIMEAIKHLMAESDVPPRGTIGFEAPAKTSGKKARRTTKARGKAKR